jgi:predicted Zn-ribbon and HTH transcriptional regulator
MFIMSEDIRTYMVEIQCGDCGTKYELENIEEAPKCPDCGFGPQKCNHPVSDREEESIYSVDEGTYVNRTMCGKCGTPL